MMTKKSFLAPNFAPKGDYRCYIILDDALRILSKQSSPTRESVLNYRDKRHPCSTVWVIDSDYAMTREIINVETGEYMEYYI